MPIISKQVAGIQRRRKYHMMRYGPSVAVHQTRTVSLRCRCHPRIAEVIKFRSVRSHSTAGDMSYSDARRTIFSIAFATRNDPGRLLSAQGYQLENTRDH